MKVIKVDNKAKDWKVITIEINGASIADVSVNRTGKKGEVFPDFDGITEGSEVNGQLWKSPTGKQYLFPPKEIKGSAGNAQVLQKLEEVLNGQTAIRLSLNTIIANQRPKPVSDMPEYPENPYEGQESPF